MRHHPLVLTACLLALPTLAWADLYGSSVVGTEFDFLRADDPSVFRCLHDLGRARREMPDKTDDAELIQDAFGFAAHFDDGTQLEIHVDVDFETEAAARAEAQRYTHRLGRLPTALRRGVQRLVVHHRGPESTAFSDVGLIVIYAENATRRIASHDLEETLFHESVHATFDAQHARSAAWRAAQESDGDFVTGYGRRHPAREDLAESALFAFTLLHHPERIPPADSEQIRKTIPARIAYVAKLLPPDQPRTRSVGPAHDCEQARAAKAKPTAEPRPQDEPAAD